MSTFDDLTKSLQAALQEANQVCAHFTTQLNLALKASLLANVERQEAIVRVMCLLPEKYTHDQIESALTRAGIHPDHLYLALSVAHFNTVLTKFYEAMEE